MITTTEEMRAKVYEHLYQKYGKFAMQIFPYLTKEIAAMIANSAYTEMVQMAQGGYLKDYYERLKNNAVQEEKMTDEELMKRSIYDDNLYNRLILKVFNKEAITKQEHDYMSYCYHYDEYRAYGEVQV